ncbi:hypothetical protein pEaSNUABM56_00052 [Erwinia phage pEa_SNUABM_56]|uniref:Putative rIIA protein n=1 Tax=Erwinia phage pEp_SNUABM_01 TaxID=2601643 RepID=A0A5J6DAE8_9CAUD|nr:RIIA lysis inhibitor [Erwinia phage pEp_SNUABM_01]QEQ94852.1 putative rIIA protein [Erwinia phage pEp_SNUABM_01]UYL85097.1 hypothetical protein pEaSNUABM56_00052 [Erwinia phage pEa_SNUABM_56]
MIVNREYTEASVSANVESYAGGIALNAETFRIVISGIYKDKRLAAVREPLFNAFDSHIESKKTDVPIEIHSPTNLEPWFSVRDFGLGMDKEMVTKTFMILGVSTKRNNNDVVGAKGIGSKAPWAYTDMFTVTSIHNGQKTAYSAYLHKGLPRIAVLNESSTTECNGVEIKFSVEPADVDSFRTALKSCLRYVKAPYEINDPYVQRLIQDEAPVCWHRQEVDGWIVEFYNKRPGHQNVVIMGQQPYISEALKEYPDCSVTLPIGACDVSPGREYTEEGDEDGGFGEKLSAVVKQVADSIGDVIIAGLEETKDIREAKVYLDSKPKGYFLSFYGYKWLRKKMESIIGQNAGYATKTSYRKGYRGWKIDYDTGLGAWEMLMAPAVLFADKKASLKSRAVFLAEKHSMDRIHVVHVDSYGAALAEDDYFKPLFVYATSFNAPKLPTVRASRSGNIRVCVFERDGDGYQQWVNKDALADVEHYMVKTAKNQGDSTWLGEWSGARSYVKTQFDNLGVDGDEIWLVTPAAQKYLPPTAKLVTKQTWIENTKESYHEWFIRHNLISTVEVKRKMRKLFGTRTLNYRPVYDSYPHRLGKYMTAAHLHDVSRETEFVQAVRARYEKQLKKLKDEAEKRYPLITKVSFRHWNSPDFKEYRDLIDAKENKNG